MTHDFTVLSGPDTGGIVALLCRPPDPRIRPILRRPPGFAPDSPSCTPRTPGCNPTTFSRPRTTPGSSRTMRRSSAITCRSGTSSRSSSVGCLDEHFVPAVSDPDQGRALSKTGAGARAGSDPDRDPSESCSAEAARAEAVAGSFAPDGDRPRAGRGSERAQVYRPGGNRDLELDPGPTGGDASGATQVCGSRTGA